MENPGNKPAGSDWPAFRPENLIRQITGSKILHKLQERFVDLQMPNQYLFSKQGKEMIGMENAEIVTTGKSNSVRFKREPISRSDSFDTQRDKVDNGLKAARRLLKLSFRL